MKKKTGYFNWGFDLDEKRRMSFNIIVGVDGDRGETKVIKLPFVEAQRLATEILKSVGRMEHDINSPYEGIKPFK